MERPPERLLASLRATCSAAASAAAELALLDAEPRGCGALLDALAEHERRAELTAHEARRAIPSGVDPRVVGVLAMALADAASATRDACVGWCRSGDCEPELPGLTGTLRDAMRELVQAVDAFPDASAMDHAADVHRRVAEGRRLARRARAAALERGDLGEVIGRMGAIAAVERALGAGGRAASALQRLSL
jgi:hypothetical protein